MVSKCFITEHKDTKKHLKGKNNFGISFIFHYLCRAKQHFVTNKTNTTMKELKGTKTEKNLQEAFAGPWEIIEMDSNESRVVE